MQPLSPHMGVILFARHFHIGAEGIVLVGVLAAIIASQLLFQRVVLLLVNEALLVRCPRCSFQAIGRYCLCMRGWHRARFGGDAIVRCCRSYAPYPFDLDAIRKLSPCSSRRCHEHASRVYGGKAEHGDDGFAEEYGIGSDRHDCPGVRVARLACARSPAQAALRELPQQKSRGVLPEIGWFSSTEGPSEGASRPFHLAAANDRKHKARSTVPRLSGRGPLFPYPFPELMKTTRFVAGPPSKLCTQQKWSSKNEPAPANRTSPRGCETSVQS